MSTRTAASTGLAARSVTRSGCYRLCDPADLTGGQKLSEIPPREGSPYPCDRLGRAFGDDLAARLSALGAKVDDVVGGLDHVEVVLDHDDGVARIHEAVQDLEETLDVGEMKAGRRLVEYVERPPGGAPAQLRGQLDALRLAAGERRRR